jgi:hypothetical protein
MKHLLPPPLLLPPFLLPFYQAISPAGLLSVLMPYILWWNSELRAWELLQA